MELRVLHYFLAVAKEQNISAAAQSLSLIHIYSMDWVSSRQFPADLGAEFFLPAKGNRTGLA